MPDEAYQKAPTPSDEAERLASLYELKILNTPPEERFDQITKIATHLFNVPISTLTLVDSEREWFKSCQGLSSSEGARAISFCGHTILTDEIFIIPDALKDPRFAGNPMVVGEPYIRFYAGAPLHAADGKRVGAFCIKDRKPRKMSPTEIDLLKSLSAWAELELNSQELSLALESRKKAETKVIELNAALRLLNKILRHDVLNDLTVVKGFIELYVEGKGGMEKIQAAINAVERGIRLIEQVKALESAISTGKPLQVYELDTILKRIINLFPAIQFHIDGNGQVLADEALDSVIENIVFNAQIHGKTKKVDFIISEKNNFIEIKIADYGIGIPSEVKEKLFTEGFKYGEAGHTGLGLYIVKKTLERYGGDITIEDNKPSGTIFILTLRKSPSNAQK
ncbi:GAF domain-containing sensor histidine kinase [Candidatus Microgenomates bacterium]|nr:GAF domain-containing sensor histidine kinase [Candidatus Microgenomates bacterium]